MKTWIKIQKASIIAGMAYGLWLGCNIDATDKESFSALVIVALAVVVALSMLIEKE